MGSTYTSRGVHQHVTRGYYHSTTRYMLLLIALWYYPLSYNFVHVVIVFFFHTCGVLAIGNFTCGICVLLQSITEVYNK